MQEVSQSPDHRNTPGKIENSKLSLACLLKNSQYMLIKSGIQISKEDFARIKEQGGVLGMLRRSRCVEKNLKRYGFKVLVKALKQSNIKCRGAFMLERQNVKVDKEFGKHCRILKKYFGPGMLKLNFQKEDNLGDWLKDLSLGISCFDRLEEMNLNFFDSRMKNKEINMINASLRKLKYLRNLHFSVRKSNKIRDGGVRKFCQVLRRLDLMETIFLNFSHNYQITNAGLKQVLESIKNLRKLERIDIDFSRCGKITDSSLEVLQNGFTKAKQLKEVSLNFCWTQLKTYGLLLIGKALRQHYTLQKLKLNFTQTDIFSQNTSKFFQEIQGLDHLQHFEFSLQTYAENEGLRVIGRFLKKLKSLEIIVLDFSSSSEITDGGLYDFARELRQRDTIKAVNLDLSFCDKISLSGVKHLFELYELSPEPLLNFNFKKCEQIKPYQVLNQERSVKRNILLQSRSQIFLQPSQGQQDTPELTFCSERFYYNLCCSK